MIINNATKLMQLMGMSPYEFVMQANQKQIERLNAFKHRTFQPQDLQYFIHSLRNIYQNHGGLETVFTKGFQKGPLDSIRGASSKNAIIHFHQTFFELTYLERTLKHLGNPAKGSAAKRINMFLRWMVRSNQQQVDFGLWNNISPSLLSCPLDVHSGNVARKLGLLKRRQNDWKGVMELDGQLRNMDANDPVKYDFALFGLGVFEGFGA